ncbi:CLASP [Symbiodinium sp. CCMP2456]|nr:CLASP [Symbiodinium sp. CCMP2456]
MTDGDGDAKRRRVAPRLPRFSGAPRSSVAVALREAGGTWHEALCFAESPALSVPGVRLARAVSAGTLLCRVPSRLHFSRPQCQAAAPAIYAGCEALPSADPEKRGEAADALCMALLLSSQRSGKAGQARDAKASGEEWPALWRALASVLLGFGKEIRSCACVGVSLWLLAVARQDFEEQKHPYTSAWQGCVKSDHSSAEPEPCHCRGRVGRAGRGVKAVTAIEELLAAQAQYVRTVYSCICDTLSSEHLRHLDEGLFLLSWLCLLTRRFGGPHGSALVPGGRHLYCVVLQRV